MTRAREIELAGGKTLHLSMDGAQIRADVYAVEAGDGRSWRSTGYGYNLSAAIGNALNRPSFSSAIQSIVRYIEATRGGK